MPASNIQQVRYNLPDNRPSPWEAGLQGVMSGMSGYYGRQQQQQKNLMALLPVLAQMKMLTPGGKDVKVPGSNLSFGINAPVDTQADLNRARTAWYNKRDPIKEKLVNSYIQSMTFEGKQPDPAVIDSIINTGNFPRESKNTSNNDVKNGKSLWGIASDWVKDNPWAVSPLIPATKAVKEYFKKKGKKEKVVRLKSNGQLGTIPEEEFDPAIYEEVEQ